MNCRKGVMTKGQGARLKESRYQITPILVRLFPLCKRAWQRCFDALDHYNIPNLLLQDRLCKTSCRATVHTLLCFLSPCSDRKQYIMDKESHNGLLLSGNDCFFDWGKISRGPSCLCLCCLVTVNPGVEIIWRHTVFTCFSSDGCSYVVLRCCKWRLEG